MVSILTALYNRLDLTRDFWVSLQENPPVGKWEIIWIDDGSTDGTRDWLNGIGAWSWELGAVSLELIAWSLEHRLILPQLFNRARIRR
jgi:hypothetical protein